MEFRKCSIGGILYGVPDLTGSPKMEITDNDRAFTGKVDTSGGGSVQELNEWMDTKLALHLGDSSHENYGILKEALLLLALCHTVIPEAKKDGSMLRV
jgi:hypothetical protein